MGRDDHPACGNGNRVSKIHCCKVEWVQQDNNWKIKEIPGTEFVLDADIVLLAMGFLHVAHEGLDHRAGIGTEPARRRGGK